MNSQSPSNATPIMRYLQVQRDLEFAMPPKGMSKCSVILAGKRYTRYTWRCPADGCWYVCKGHGEIHAAAIRAHQNSVDGSVGYVSCPSPPMRESLPSGLKEIEKLWREMDDVVDAMYDGTEYRGMTGSDLKSYAKGISFSITMKDGELFPNAAAVAKHAAERRNMRLGRIPYKRTPSSQGWHFRTDDPEHGLYEVTPVIAKPRKEISPKTMAAVRKALDGGLLERKDVMSMYDLTGPDIDYILST